MVFRPYIVAFFWVVAVLRLAGAAAATPDKMTGLLTNSPFGTGKTGAAAASGGGEALEFRSVLEEGGNKYFSIYETSTHRSNWVGLNDPVNGFSVKTYDPAKETVTVEYQNKALTLAIKKAPAVAQVMQPPMPPPGANGMAPSVNNPGAPGAPSAVDQQRIQQIQEEIRRRRALRSQSATVPGNAPVAPPNYGNGPQPTPSTSAGPVPQPSTSAGPQILPAKN